MSEEDGEASSTPGPVRRKVRRVLVVSSSSSDSDESVGMRATRKKRLRVLSDEGSSDSSDSSLICGRQRRRTNAALKDSDSSESEQDEVAAVVVPSGFASDSSEGNSDKCSICLLRFKDQPIGTPVNCEHIFCLDCIVEWSKNVNTCPVDRITFESIVVRSCLGGKVLRTEPVKVVERRSSVDMLVVEDPTVCEVCGSSESEETMLLCDGCDLGFHMACLTPPLSEIPLEQWFCPNCVSDSEENFIYLSEVNDLLDELRDIERPMAARRHPLREARNVRRSNRSAQSTDQPSTSSGQRNRAIDNAVLAISSRVGTKRKAPKRRRRTRRTRTVLVEYEVTETDKFPITKKVTVKKKLKKRKSKRQPRTAARRSHVRASVRARLSTLQNTERNIPDSTTSNLVVQRQRAGIPSLSLFGNPYELDYFCDEPDESASTAVATRSTSSILNSYRQARRKMVTIPSPTHASSAPDLLSNILESQALLHAKNAVLSVAVDGQVNIKLQKTEPPRLPKKKQADKTQSKDSNGRLDLTKAEDCTKKAPLHGQSRGGWGGGYRGEYTREQTNNYNRSGSREQRDSAHGRAQQTMQGQWRDEGNYDNNYQRQTPMYDHYERDRRTAEAQRPGQQQGRHSFNNSWPQNGGHQSHRTMQRHSFGGYDNPLDMRTGLSDRNMDEGRRRFNFGPLPEPPVFKMNENNSDDREEQSPELVIDTEKYDPTEPTNDDSGDENGPTQTQEIPQVDINNESAIEPVKVTSQALQSAVEQVLTQHLVDAAPQQSDDEQDGDCPNFNIYSAASVHIANTTAASLEPETEHNQPTTIQPNNSLNRQYNESLSKRCPITINTRNPIKIKLNTTTLVRPPVSLYDEELDQEPQSEYSKTDAPSSESNDITINTIADTVHHSDVNIEKQRDSTPDLEDEPHLPDKELTPERLEADNASETKDTNEEPKENILEKEGSESESEMSQSTELKQQESDEQETPPNHTTNEQEDKLPSDEETGDKMQEKMTESISDTEDSRSYTPCLDEKVKDPSIEACVLEGLDTELISEDEGHEDFPESNEPTPPTIDKEKKKKDTKKDKSKSKKADVSFKKLSKSGKERNYRDKDRKRSRSASAERREERSRRREKRKDLERYDVRNLVTEKKRRVKDAFGRDISPPGSPIDKRRSTSRESRNRRSLSKERNKRRKRSLSRGRRSHSKGRRSISRNRRSLSRKRSLSRNRIRMRRSISRRSLSRSKKSTSRPRRSLSRGRRAPSHDRRSLSPEPIVRRRTLTPPPRPKRRRISPEPIAKAKASKKKKRERSPSPKEKKRRARKRSRDDSPDKKITKKKKNKKKVETAEPEPEPEEIPEPIAKHRRHRRHLREAPSSKEVFTSGNNILVSVSFKETGRQTTAEEQLAMAIEADEQERRREAKRERRRRRQEEKEAPKPVAIIDLDGSPFREIAPSPADVIVLSDSEPPKEEDKVTSLEQIEIGPHTPPAPTPPPQTVLTLEDAQGSGQAEALLDQRPLASVEKVLALLHSTRITEPEPIVDKPPNKISALPLPSVKPLGGDSPYSPASSDFGELFSPPNKADNNKNHNNNKADNKPMDNGNKNGSNSKVDEENLKVMDECPSSAVEMQVKSKFLKKLNRQERVVEEVKLVLKPHYNKKHVTKEEYKDILRRAVPKICHNRSGEINPTKIQALIEAYVRKSRKRRKMAA